MKTRHSSALAAFRLVLLFCLTACLPVHSAVRQAWVQHFDGGFPAKASQPVAMQLDSAGNIYVVGSAANSSNLLDYITVKYEPTGALLWSKRYGSTNGLSNVPRAIGLDTNDNLYITGTSVTVKYSSMGDELWTAPYGGRGLAVQGTNLLVTGFSSTNFVTAALSMDGLTKWVQVYKNTLGGPDESINVFVDESLRVLVAGTHTFYRDRIGNYIAPFFVLYDQQGTELTATNPTSGFSLPRQPSLHSAIQGKSGRLYLLGEIQPNDYPFQCLARTSDGANVWDFLGHASAQGAVDTAVIESGDSVCVAGSFYTDSKNTAYLYDDRSLTPLFGVVQVKSDGTAGWRGDFSGVYTNNTQPLALPGLAEAITVDQYDHPATTGLVYLSPFVSSANIATAKYDTNGTLLWAQQYNGAANGYDEGKAIVADSSGNAYVAGLSTTTEGGTEIVLIKYSEYTSIEKSPSGSMLLQFPGTPGQPYKVQATTNFPNWLDIGLGTAAPNGLLQFEDTNATQYPFRFYQTVTPVQ